MKIVYITGNYETVQDALYRTFKSQKDEFKLFHYSLRGYAEEFDEDKNIIRYGIRAKWMRGPVFYMTRLNRVGKYYLKYLDKEAPDIFHANRFMSDGIMCRMICKKTHIPYVVSVRDSDINVDFLWMIPWIKIAGLKVLEDSKAIILLSETYRNKLFDNIPSSLRNKIEKKTYVIPNGIDRKFLDNKYRRNRVPAELKILYVGKVMKRKNIELTIEAVKLLINKGFSVTYTIVGDIVDESYRELIDSNKFVSYLPRMDIDGVIEQMRKADLFVMPSHTETFGLTYGEAMSQGLPIIYTRGQGFDGQFAEGEVGYHVSDKDKVELAEKIQLIWDNYIEISNRCVDRADKFDWDRIVKKIRAIYKGDFNDGI